MKDSSTILKVAKDFLDQVEVENEDLIDKLLYHATEDEDILEAIKIVLERTTNGENPFVKYSYYDIMGVYEDIKNSK